MKCMKKQSQHVNIVLLSYWKWLSPRVKSIRRGKPFFEVTGEGTFHVILFLTSSHIILNRCMTVHRLHWENKTSSACTDQLSYYVWLLSETRSSTWIIKAVLPEDFCIWLNDTPWQNSGRTGFCKKVNCVFFSLSALSLLGTVLALYSSHFLHSDPLHPWLRYNWLTVDEWSLWEGRAELYLIYKPPWPHGGTVITSFTDNKGPASTFSVQCVLV